MLGSVTRVRCSAVEPERQMVERMKMGLFAEGIGVKGKRFVIFRNGLVMGAQH